jgi:hypothetical protein
MTDEQLIGYCAIHCTTERTLFSDTQINRMLALAGHPPEYEQRVSVWLSVRAVDMLPLCEMAR